jgi:hypothetical protein
VREVADGVLGVVDLVAAAPPGSLEVALGSVDHGVDVADELLVVLVPTFPRCD